MNFLKRIVSSKLAGIEAGVISIVLVALTGMLTIIFAFIFAAPWVGRRMHDTLTGFAVVAAFFFLAFLITAVYRKKSIRPMLEDAITGEKTG